jgi:nickel/cobalt transporter (NicO) family protein
MSQRTHPVTFTVGLALAFGLIPAPAFAHLVNTNVSEFYAGLLHPLTSVEHLFPAVALTLLAGRCGTQAARWTVAVFPLALMVGTWVGQGFGPLNFVHPASLVAVSVLGLLLVARRPLPLGAMATAAVGIGLLLGYRSGVDMANAGVGGQFIPGVGLTGLIMAALGSAWIISTLSPRIDAALRLAGASLALVGLYMLVDLVTAGAPDAARNVGLPTEERFMGLLTNDATTLPAIVTAFLAAVGWEAAHALTPEHGKAIVAAYLVGSRGTMGHALYLGLTVTATHTIAVFTLGLIALYASRYVLAEQLFPWFATVSGLIVIALGATMLAKRARLLFRRHVPDGHPHHAEHDHTRHHDHGHHGHPHEHGDHQGHSHLPPGADGAAVTVRSLLGLGISGGLLPCPSALVLLLTTIAFQRTGLGLLLLIAFSLGLASVLTGVGWLFLKGRQLLRDAPGVATASRYIPAVSALVILILGVGITVEALWRLASS